MKRLYDSVNKCVCLGHASTLDEMLAIKEKFISICNTDEILKYL